MKRHKNVQYAAPVKSHLSIGNANLFKGTLNPSGDRINSSAVPTNRNSQPNGRFKIIDRKESDHCLGNSHLARFIELVGFSDLIAGKVQALPKLIFHLYCRFSSSCDPCLIGHIAIAVVLAPFKPSGGLWVQR